jgi:hypothetical protein
MYVKLLVPLILQLTESYSVWTCNALLTCFNNAVKSWIITMWWYKLCPQIYLHDLDILGRTLYWNLGINLFTTCPEGHINYLYYIVLLQTVVDSVSILNITFLIKNILCFPYKLPDEAEVWIGVVTWYFFWDIMLHHWVVE